MSCATPDSHRLKPPELQSTNRIFLGPLQRCPVNWDNPQDAENPSLYSAPNIEIELQSASNRKECAMMSSTSRKIAFTVFAVVAMGIASKAQVLNTLYSLSGSDGEDPRKSLQC